MQELLDELRIDDEWDLLVTGDGSGSGWGKGAGWGAVAVEREARDTPRLFYGAMNTGTSNVAEILPYLHVLTWYHAHCSKQKLLGRHYRTVHIVSDSEYVVNQGKRAGYGDKTLNRGLWIAIDSIARQGFALIWHFRRRESHTLNQFCDHLSRASRLWFERPETVEIAAASSGVHLADQNEEEPDPSELPARGQAGQ